MTMTIYIDDNPKNKPSTFKIKITQEQLERYLTQAKDAHHVYELANPNHEETWEEWYANFIFNLHMESCPVPKHLSIENSLNETKEEQNLAGNS